MDLIQSFGSGFFLFVVVFGTKGMGIRPWVWGLGFGFKVLGFGFGLGA